MGVRWGLGMLIPGTGCAGNEQRVCDSVEVLSDPSAASWHQHTEEGMAGGEI